jgi:hypothetical protein
MIHTYEDERLRFRQRAARWREVFFAQKYRFDLGQSFLVIVNFTLLMISASDKLMVFFGIPRLRSLLLLIAPVCLVGVWFFGYFMDKVVRAGQMVERQQMRRSEVWVKHTEQMDRIERSLNDLAEHVEGNDLVPRLKQGRGSGRKRHQ